MKRIRTPHGLAEHTLFLSLPLIIAFLVFVRPPTPFYALPLAPSRRGKEPFLMGLDLMEPDNG